MTLLGLGDNDSVQDYYLPNGKVDENKLRQHLSNFKSKFANDTSLGNDVERLVNPDDA